MVKVNRSIAVVMLSLVLCVSLVPTVAFAHPFKDVSDNAWYAKDGSVEYVFDKGYMKGYADTGNFGPENTITRAELVTVLYRALFNPHDAKANDSGSANETPFTDVEDGAYYTAAINYAYQNGFVTGYSDTGLFVPDSPISRQEMITILGRTVDFEMKDTETTYYDDGTVGVAISCFPDFLSSFSDGATVAVWAQRAMQWGCRFMIIGGDNPGIYDEGKTIRPNTPTTRAEAAKMIRVYCQVF